MKSLVARWLGKVSGRPGMQKWLDASLGKAADYYRRNRMPALSGEQKTRYDRWCGELTRELTVRSGPFKGMKYPGAESAGSALIPKLLGSYERELHPELERLIAKGYDQVIDVGCAEGYYATGMALRLPESRVFAYDTSAGARALCSAMVRLNGVSGRVSVETSCTPETLISFSRQGRLLVICDCEGYEKTLFSAAVMASLKDSDFLIETHDFIDVSISTVLTDLLSRTHRLTSVLSLDDIQKAKHYQDPGLGDLPVSERFHLLREGRPMIMEWLIAEPL